MDPKKETESGKKCLHWDKFNEISNCHLPSV